MEPGMGMPHAAPMPPVPQPFDEDVPWVGDLAARPPRALQQAMCQASSRQLGYVAVTRPVRQGRLKVALEELLTMSLGTQGMGVCSDGAGLDPAGAEESGVQCMGSRTAERLSQVNVGATGLVPVAGPLSLPPPAAVSHLGQGSLGVSQPIVSSCTIQGPGPEYMSMQPSGTAPSAPAVQACTPAAWQPDSSACHAAAPAPPMHQQPHAPHGTLPPPQPQPQPTNLQLQPILLPAQVTRSASHTNLTHTNLTEAGPSRSSGVSGGMTLAGGNLGVSHGASQPASMAGALCCAVLCVSWLSRA